MAADGSVPGLSRQGNMLSASIMKAMKEAKNRMVAKIILHYIRLGNIKTTALQKGFDQVMKTVINERTIS